LRVPSEWRREVKYEAEKIEGNGEGLLRRGESRIRETLYESKGRGVVGLHQTQR